MISGWRLCRAPYAALDGEGARRFGGRWNSPGQRVVYLAEHPALAVLEVLVHLDVAPEDLPADYVLLQVTLPDSTVRLVTDGVSEARAIGGAWLAGMASPVARVASALVPVSDNLLLNPHHPDATAARIEQTLPFQFDPRLLAP